MASTVALVAIAFAGCPKPGNSVSAEDAAAHAGSTRTVCDKVADVRLDPVSTGPLYLDLVRPAPDQVLTIVVQDRSSAGGVRYLGHDVCASGVVEATQERPRLVVKTPGQVHVTEITPVEVDVAGASRNVGKVVEVCDKVAAVRADPASELKGYIDFVAAQPDSPLTVTVDDRRQISDANQLPGRVACVVGYVVKTPDGKLAIALRDPRELSTR